MKPADEKTKQAKKKTISYKTRLRC